MTKTGSPFPGSRRPLRPARGASTIALVRIWVGVAALLGCGNGEPGPGLFPPAAELRRIIDEARDLKSRHRSSEAVERLAPLFRDGELRSGLSDRRLAHELRSLYASLLINLSRPREAIPLLEELSAEDPDDRSATLSLARAHLDLGQGDAALAAFEKLPRSLRSEHFVEYGRALLAAGRSDEGRAALASGLVRDPWADEAYLRLGLALNDSGSRGRAFLERYRAAEAYRVAKQKALGFEHGGKTAAALHFRARAERERGNLFAAMVLENGAIQQDVGFGLAYLELGRLTLFLERPQDAIEVLARLTSNPAVDEILSEARSRLKQTEARDEAEAVRLRIGREMRGLGLRESVPQLLSLAQELHRLDRLEDARRLILFLRGLAPRDAAIAAAVPSICAEPADVFFRLSARARPATAAGREPFEAELTALGIDPSLTRSFLATAPGD